MPKPRSTDRKAIWLKGVRPRLLLPSGRRGRAGSFGWPIGVTKLIFYRLMFDQLKEKRNVANKECGSKKSQACPRHFADYWPAPGRKYARIRRCQVRDH